MLFICPFLFSKSHLLSVSPCRTSNMPDQVEKKKQEQSSNMNKSKVISYKTDTEAKRMRSKRKKKRIMHSTSFFLFSTFLSTLFTPPALRHIHTHTLSTGSSMTRPQCPCWYHSCRWHRRLCHSPRPSPPRLLAAAAAASVSLVGEPVQSSWRAFGQQWNLQNKKSAFCTTS